MDWAKGEKGWMKIEETCNQCIYRIFLYIINIGIYNVIDISCQTRHLAKVMYHVCICKIWSSKHMWSKNSLRCHPALRRHLQMALVDQQGPLGSTGSKSSYLNTQDPHWARHIHIILSSSVWRRALKRLERLSKWSWVFLGNQHAGNVVFNLGRLVEQFALPLEASLQKFNAPKKGLSCNHGNHGSNRVEWRVYMNQSWKSIKCHPCWFMSWWPTSSNWSHYPKFHEFYLELATVTFLDPLGNIHEIFWAYSQRVRPGTAAWV